MSISTHILLDIVVGIATTVAIAVAVSNAFTVAGALYQRAKARGARPRHGGAVPTLNPTKDAARDLVLR
jgi:hypothetical protein